MATGIHAPVLKSASRSDEERAELECVLASAGFRRAPALTHLLRYLCEKRFAGESSQIKEYSIGVEVFSRGVDFDQESNSIVRVEANRLRKRLAEYYIGEGAGHSLQITIPLGQYVPEFVSVGVEKRAATNRWQVVFALLSKLWWLQGIAILVLLAAGAWLYGHRSAPAASPLHLADSAAVDVARIGPPVGEEMRILAGASRGFVDHAGKLWNADAYFSGGNAVKSQVHHIERTQDPDFYRSSRQGNFRYEIPLRPGVYELHLHFAETVYGPEGTEPGGEGSRVFSVRANGQSLIDNLDIVADAGASDTADVKVFHDIAPAADGRLHLEFFGSHPAILSAIEILPGVRGRIRPVRLLARQTPYYTNDSQWWSPDNYFSGGQVASYQTPVSGTDDPEFYESERWGNFSYAIPVTPGRYTVALYFVARHGAERGAHRFNLFCNGRALLQNFDPQQEAHGGDVLVRRFTGLEANAQGKIALAFVPVTGYAAVSGIEVLQQ